MSTPLESNAATLLALEGQAISYRRGADTVVLRAVIGQRTFESSEANGSRVQIISTDFLVDPSKLRIAGQEIKPERRDQIDRIVRGLAETYQPLPESVAPMWEWSDPEHTLLRIHCKKIG
jgi:hypothetical protein